MTFESFKGKQHHVTYSRLSFTSSGVDHGTVVQGLNVFRREAVMVILQDVRKVLVGNMNLGNNSII